MEEILRRAIQACSGCGQDYAQITSLCPSCTDKSYLKQCPYYVKRTERFDNGGDINMTVNGLWMAKEACRSCQSCVVWKKNAGSFHKENYRVHCLKDAPCLDERKAPGCMMDEAHLPPPAEEVVIERKPVYQAPKKGKRGRR